MDDSDSEDRPHRTPPHAPVPMLPRPGGSGFAAEGPGFYVWDETACAARRSAAELWRVARGRED